MLILGSGPNRIGQGIEFDYSCVHAAVTLSQAGFETVMVNCNPETVSTDYDTADRLYFEPLTFEDVLEVFHAETQSAAGGPGWSGSSCSSAGRPRSGWRSGWPTRAFPSSEPRREPSIWPRTAAHSATC